MQNLLMKVSRVAEQVADINGLLVAEVSMTCGWKWEVLLSVPVIALLGCGAPRERCLDPDVCDDLMTVVGLPLTHEWRGSATFEFDGVVHTYAEVHYSGSGDLPGATMCLLWDSALGQGRVVYWTSAFNVPGSWGAPAVNCPTWFVRVPIPTASGRSSTARSSTTLPARTPRCPARSGAAAENCGDGKSEEPGPIRVVPRPDIPAVRARCRSPVSPPQMTKSRRAKGSLRSDSTAGANGWEWEPCCARVTAPP